MLKLGYKASAEQFGPTDLLNFSCLAEEVGFDSIFVSDHFQPWKHTDGHAPNALAWLGALGARTSRAIFGTSVLTPTFRYHPSIVAQIFGTLGAMFPGRVVLGVGTGELLNEVPSSGIAWPGAKERRDRLRESIALINKLWTEDRVTFEGQFYRTENATIYDKPKDKVPVWVAASGPLAAQMAGQVAEGFICTSGKAPSLYSEQLVPKVEEGAARRGRDSSTIERMIEVKVSFDTDATQAKELTRHWAALALSPEEKTGVEDPVEMERLADALPLDRAASRWIVSSDPDEQVEKIRPYVELGFRHLVFHAPGPDQAALPEALCRAGPAAPAQGVRVSAVPLPSPCPSPRKRGEGSARRRTSVRLEQFARCFSRVPLPACGERDRVRGTRSRHDAQLTITGLVGVPLVKEGDDLAADHARRLCRNRPRA